MYLYLLNFNNYYNRIVKKFDTLEEYAPYVIGTPQKVEFNPNDGIDTEQVVNWDTDIPNYVLVTEENQVLSRWFVIEGVRIRKGQYKLTLHRDVVADNYDEVVNAPCFIEKATLSDTNPLIFNSENMGFNEIKTKETSLKDESGCAWIVGYMARTDGTSPVSMSGKIKSVPNADFEVNGPLSDWEYNNMIGPKYYEPTTLTWSYDWVQPQISSTTGGTVRFETVSNNIGFNENHTGKGLTMRIAGELDENIARGAIERYKTSLINACRALVGAADADTIYKIKSLAGKVIKYKQNGVDKYKRINIATVPGEGASYHYVQTTDGSLYNLTKNILTQSFVTADFAPAPTGNYTGYPKVFADGYKLQLSYVDVDKSELSYNIPANRLHATDAPYDIFAIPYGDNIKIDNVKNSTIQPSKNLMLQVAMSMAEQQGAKIFDIQLLPYCPMQEIISLPGHVDLGSLPTTDDVGYTTIDNTASGAVSIPIGVILFPTKTQFTFDIRLSEPITIYNTKVQAETEKYRLVSPNYNGQFEFNAAKNGGVEYFNVDCTYIPYNPYIHINPNFKRLYGRDFNDSRGLICGGDFSIARMTDAWTNYQLNNKNYQNIFDRQIQSMEFQNNMQLVSDSINAGTGALQGGVSGGIMGGLSGHPAGMAAGALFGGAASAAGGVGDVLINRALRNDTLDLTKDQFGYQLGNIKAIPDSIAKTTAFTNNNKIFPILEFYTCTPQEIQALERKIKYNGMTVMAIGKLSDYIQPEPSYIKGKLIRLENVADDFHFIKSIADEINKGIFI